ncbi:prealbumin-like fold domain-containing protein [Corynebacterium kutscheri]|uniref:prealbumin-like fold domain-containing protein n=1 Tax=Corynebacterium kutscheri TaxID=35755 RepID=UPI0037BE34FC
MVANNDINDKKAQQREYKIVDNPKFTTAALITKVVRVDGSGAETELAKTATGYLVDQGTIEPNTSQTVKVRVYFNLDGDNTQLQCNSEGAGYGGFNQVDVSYKENNDVVVTDTACAPIPEAAQLNFAKTNAKVEEVDHNEDQLLATYDLVVTNPEQGIARNYYELVDTPEFVSGAKITEVKLASAQSSTGQALTTVLTTPLARGAGWLLTPANTMIAIAPGETHTYKLQILVDKLPPTAPEETMTCNEGQAHRGLYNRAHITVPSVEGKKELSDIDCVDAQSQPGKLSIDKQVVQVLNQHGNGNAQVEYKIVVSNDAPGAIDHQVSVTDIPQFGVAVGDPISFEKCKSEDTDYEKITGTNGVYILDNKVLAAGQRLEYFVRVTFKLPKVGTPEEELRCKDTGNAGLFNKAVATYGVKVKRSIEATACENIPTNFADPTIKKTVDQVVPVADRTGYSQVYYTVRVAASADARQQKVTVIDKPDFGGVTIESLEIDRQGTWTKVTADGDSYHLVEDLNLSPDTFVELKIRVTVRNAVVSASADVLQCVDATPGKGLYNQVVLNWPGGSAQDDACAPSPQDTALAELEIEKVTSAGEQLDRGLGWQFSLYYYGEDGKQQGSLVSTLNEDSTSGQPNSVTTGKILRAGHYQLVETKAPEGYELLPQPVDIQLTFDGDTPKMNASNQANFPGVELIQREQPSVGEKIWVIQVADVRRGELPQAGGRGVGLFVLGAAMIFGCAMWLRRRNK